MNKIRTWTLQNLQSIHWYLKTNVRSENSQNICISNIPNEDPISSAEFKRTSNLAEERKYTYADSGNQTVIRHIYTKMSTQNTQPLITRIKNNTLTRLLKNDRSICKNIVGNPPTTTANKITKILYILKNTPKVTANSNHKWRYRWRQRYFWRRNHETQCKMKHLLGH